MRGPAAAFPTRMDNSSIDFMHSNSHIEIVEAETTEGKVEMGFLNDKQVADQGVRAIDSFAVDNRRLVMFIIILCYVQRRNRPLFSSLTNMWRCRGILDTCMYLYSVLYYCLRQTPPPPCRSENNLTRFLEAGTVSGICASSV